MLLNKTINTEDGVEKFGDLYSSKMEEFIGYPGIRNYSFLDLLEVPVVFSIHSKVKYNDKYVRIFNSVKKSFEDCNFTPPNESNHPLTEGELKLVILAALDIYILSDTICDGFSNYIEDYNKSTGNNSEEVCEEAINGYLDILLGASTGAIYTDSIESMYGLLAVTVVALSVKGINDVKNVKINIKVQREGVIQNLLKAYDEKEVDFSNGI